METSSLYPLCAGISPDTILQKAFEILKTKTSAAFLPLGLWVARNRRKARKQPARTIGIPHLALHERAKPL